ncbi:MAG TPA: SusC/RagA family TonB-linked outer membrane protein [Balneolaceae bacterium]
MKKPQVKPFYRAVLSVLIGIYISFSPQASSAMGQKGYTAPTINDSLNNFYYSAFAYSGRVSELNRIISVNAENKPLNKVLEAVALKAGLGIVYNAGLSSLKNPVTLHRDKIKVLNALEILLKGTGYEPSLTRMKELVFEKKYPVELASKVIQHEISGRVTDSETGNPMPGVNVFVKNTTIGTSTDRNGDYSLTVPSDADTLIFSFIGYAQKHVPISEATTVLNVELVQQAQAFDEVVVTALGISRDERSIGYATQEVEGEDLTFSKEQNVIGALAGKIAGVQVTGSSGASMGGTSKIKIRGVNSISGEGSPLIVVDGTPISNNNFAGRAGADYGNLAQDINPNSIKSVNVLKGPAASALYGIRGQYGVIMITTKDGSGVDDFTVQINSSFSVQKAGNFMEYQNLYGGGYTQEWQTLPNGQKYVEANADESWGPRMDGTLVREYFSFYPQDPMYGKLTPFDPHPNNVRNFYDLGYTSNQGITIAGGGENSNFRLSFNDTKITGVYPNSWLKRNNLGVSADVDVNDRWNFSTNMSYATNSAVRPTQGSEFGSRYFRQWFQRQIDMERLKDYRYDDGTVMHWNIENYRSGGVPDVNYWSNPYFLAHEYTSQDSRDRVFGNIGVVFDAMPGLSIKGFIRGDMYIQNIESKRAFGGDLTPRYTVGKYQNTAMNYELSAHYTKRWADFSLDATAGTNLYHRKYSSMYQETVGGLTTPGFFNIDASVDRPENESYLLRKKILSAYGLVSLGYRDTYYLDLSIRNDKSSTLPKDNNSYWYPSVSGSFVFSELVEWEPLSFGKFRLSYAKAGSDLDPYQTSLIYSTSMVYNGINTLSLPDQINNPDIKPSFSTSYEVGVDLNFWGRLGVHFTYYQQKNKNQIIPLNISGASGYSSAIINAGLIENQGIEFSLSATPVQKRDFSWNTLFNVSRNQNMVVELHPDIDVYTHYSTVYSGTPSYLNSYEGQAFGTLVSVGYQRDPETGKILLDDNGMPLYTDATQKFGTVLPDFTGGFQNTFYYKNFSLAAMINFQIGGQFFSRSLMLAAKTGLAPVTAAINDKGNNVREPVSEGGGVRVDGISASTGQPVTAYVDAESYYNNILGDDIYEEWVVDATYIKLSEVKLGYTFDSSVLESLPVKAVGVALFANNPLMIWQKAPSGLDPSQLSSGGQAISWYEAGQLNTVRSYGLNINITF